MSYFLPKSEMAEYQFLKEVIQRIECEVGPFVDYDKEGISLSQVASNNDTRIILWNIENSADNSLRHKLKICYARMEFIKHKMFLCSITEPTEYPFAYYDVDLTKLGDHICKFPTMYSESTEWIAW